VEMVAFDIAEIMRIGAEIGLSLNVSKCELIAYSDEVISDTLLQSFNRVEIEDAMLLGAPLFPGPALDRAWQNVVRNSLSEHHLSSPSSLSPPLNATKRPPLKPARGSGEALYSPELQRGSQQRATAAVAFCCIV